MTTFTSGWSGAAATTLPPAPFLWVHDPQQPDAHLNMQLMTSSGSIGGVSGVGWYTFVNEETENIDYALGRSDAIVQHGDQHLATFDLTWVAPTAADRTVTLTLRRRKRVLAFRFRDGSVIYGSLGAALNELVMRPPQPGNDPTTDSTTSAAGYAQVYQPRVFQTSVAAGNAP